MAQRAAVPRRSRWGFKEYQRSGGGMGRRHSTRYKRQGVAASELAVCLPVLVLLVLAMIEACTMIFLKQSLTVSAYEGVRIALLPNATTSQAQAAANSVLADRRVKNGAVTVTP